jgi:hypothetical protein
MAGDGWGVWLEVVKVEPSIAKYEGIAWNSWDSDGKSSKKSLKPPTSCGGFEIQGFGKDFLD